MIFALHDCMVINLKCKEFLKIMLFFFLFIDYNQGIKNVGCE
jgi:hypothetical protein